MPGFAGIALSLWTSQRLLDSSDLLISWQQKPVPSTERGSMEDLLRGGVKAPAVSTPGSHTQDRGWPRLVWSPLQRRVPLPTVKAVRVSAASGEVFLYGCVRGV